MKRLLILGFVLTLYSLVSAFPSLYGPTGLVTIPTAKSLHYKEMSFSYDYFQSVSQDEFSWKYSMNLGTFENLEVGIVGGQEPDEGVFVNVKYFVTDGNERLPLTFAVGFENLTSEFLTDFYLVVSKRLQPDLSLHGGFKAMFSETIDPVVMFGVEYDYNKNFKILADMNGEQTNYTNHTIRKV